MKEKQQKEYLADRMRRMMLVVWTVGAMFLVYYVVICVQQRLSLWSVVFGTLFFIAWIVVWIRLIVAPLRNRQMKIDQMLRGYELPDLEGIMPIDAADEMLCRQVQAWLDPSRAFQLNKRQVQYLALQNQINPHFLYNTLESIRSEALLSGISSVAEMTEALAVFFRYTISKVENLVTIEDELSNCETYIRIQQYRFGDRLQFEIECPDDEREEIYHCLLPKLTFQPILENSIIHGTELKMGAGHLKISLSRTERMLVVQLSDDGVGLDEKTLARINSHLGRGGLKAQMDGTSGTGLALVNVDNRIRLLFGEEYGLHVYSLPGHGTTVEILLPVITSDQDVPNREVLQ